MNTLKVPFLINSCFTNPVLDLSDALSQYEQVKLIYEPWPSGGQRPEVSFYLAYGNDAIFLKFSVKEKHYRATYKQTNEPVYKDSCVEFFIAFDETYYNFEFNALGTALVGYGLPGKREELPPSLINNIKSWVVSKTVLNDTLPFQWELTLAIPFNLFYKHSISTLKGTECRANFYKCGDDLPEPHFLCWNDITAEKPNFHLPQYFGKLIFE